MSGVITVIHRSWAKCVMSPCVPVQLCKPKWPGTDQTVAHLWEGTEKHALL